jgi:hypothetical protein
MFVKVQDAPETTETNSTFMAKSFGKVTCPRNLELFQIMIVPPEAPTEGINSKQSN